jgi:hypothetical protein
VGTALPARGGDERSHRVLIVGANFAEIACLAELYVEHGRRLADLPEGFRQGISEIVKHPAPKRHCAVLNPLVSVKRLSNTSAESGRSGSILVMQTRHKNHMMIAKDFLIPWTHRPGLSVELFCKELQGLPPRRTAADETWGTRPSRCPTTAACDNN